MKERTLLVHLTIILLITTFFAGCISSDDGGRYDGDVHDLLITSDLLPDGWYQEDSIDYDEAFAEQGEKDYVEFAGADFQAKVINDSYTTKEFIHQNITRYEAIDTTALADERAEKIKTFLEEMDNDYSVEYVIAPNVGDHSVVLKATYPIFGDELPVSNYYVICSRKDIIIFFELSKMTDADGLDVNYLLNLAKNLASQM
ncbi:MAG: hypothetical protein JW825_01640 [Candidatus Methanofastidiosa archaeon]|nr:hypothetical protein [Candidatus Methanofastidiosa archaeon]